MLNEAHLATLLIDLQTTDEEAVDRHTGHLRFDIGLLAERLVGATDYGSLIRRIGDSVVGARKTETYGSAAKLTAVNALQVLSRYG